MKRSRLQLVGVSAMYLASKMEEIYAPEIGDFAYITDDAYTVAEIRQMEMRILNVLRFNLCPPLALNFLRRFSRAGQVNLLQHNLAKYILEQSYLDYSLAPNLLPSQMAAGALNLSLLVLNEHLVSPSLRWSAPLKYYSTYSSEELLPTVKRMAGMLLTADTNSKLTAVKVNET